jgi:hypothetical protein
MTTATMSAPTANDFLGDDYQIPTGGSGAGRYLKFEEGKTAHFRILSQKALKGYEYWNVENKPVRVLEKPDTTPINIRCDDNGKPERMKHFWAMAVWDYGSSSVKLLQITQSTIQNNILGLVRDPDFGHPTKYDLKIARKGKALETEYTVMPLHKPMPEDAIAEYQANPVYLEALLHSADPFAADSAKYAVVPIVKKEVITEAQVKRLWTIANKQQWTKEMVGTMLAENKYFDADGAASSKVIPVAEYDRIIEILKDDNTRNHYADDYADAMPNDSEVVDSEEIANPF